jgi:hypothetical protein
VPFGVVTQASCISGFRFKLQLVPKWFVDSARAVEVFVDLIMLIRFIDSFEIVGCFYLLVRRVVAWPLSVPSLNLCSVLKMRLRSYKLSFQSWERAEYLKQVSASTSAALMLTASHSSLLCKAMRNQRQ